MNLCATQLSPSCQVRPGRSLPAPLLRSRLGTSTRPGRCVARAGPEDKPDGGFESLFSKELKRRGIDSVDSIDGGDTQPAASSAPKDAPSSSTPTGAVPGTNPFASSSTTRTRSRAPPPMMAPGAFGGPDAGVPPGDDQRQRSMNMVTEGLEGLPGRASQLLQLGGSIFLGFLPFMLAFSVIFSGIYFVFGDSFLHGGRQYTSPPSYIDPQKLLSEPTVDPFITFDNVNTMYSAPPADDF